MCNSYCAFPVTIILVTSNLFNDVYLCVCVCV